MIVWLLSTRRRKYALLAAAIVVADLIIGPMIIAWEIKVLKGML